MQESPMEYSTAAALSSTGSLLLLPDEIVRKMQAGIDVYVGDVKSDVNRHGIATVTTHRLVWISKDGKRGFQWSLAQVNPCTRDHLYCFIAFVGNVR